jgi:hypothetical protein
MDNRSAAHSLAIEKPMLRRNCRLQLYAVRAALMGTHFAPIVN